MSGLMRQKICTAKRAIAVFAFSLIIPFSSGAAHALPKGGRPGKEVPAQKYEDPNPLFASMRATMGGMLASLLRKKKFAELRELQQNNEKRSYSGTREPLKHAASELSREMGILAEAGKFNEPERLMAALASVHVTLPHLARAYPSRKPLVQAYLAGIRKLGSGELAGAAEQWLKNGRGDVLAFYKRISECKGIGR